MRSLGLAVLLVAFGGAVSAQDNKRPLTVDDVEELIRLRLPDARLAIEVRQRGVARLLTHTELRRLRDMGAGPESQAALERFLQLSPLIVITQPPIEGLRVTIGENSVLTNAEGQATITGLVPASYTVIMEKPPAYPRTERRVFLAEGGSREYVTLRPAPGKLDVLVDIEGALIEISSRGTYRAPVRELELPPGTYAVSIRAPLFLPYRTSATVEAGQLSTLEADLEPDLEALESELQRMLARHDFPKFRAKATFALQGGAHKLAAVKLLHHHASGLHEAVLTIYRSGLYYEPHGSCHWKAGLIPFDRIKDAVVVQHCSSGVLLRLVVATGKNLESRDQLNFAVLGSSLQQETVMKPLNVGRVNIATVRTTRNCVWSPSGAHDTISMIAWLISKVQLHSAQ
jgi:hypothetical protein